MKLLAIALLAGTLGLVALELPVRRATSGAPEQPASAREDAALRALDRARTHKGALVGARGERREALREQAIESYRDVLREHPGAPRVAAEAAFRAGELLRAAGRAQEAEAEFRAAQRLGAGTPFRARGGLELGHLARRAERPLEALREYERVRADPLAELEHRHEAASWAARVHAAEGRFTDAARLFERVALDAEDPLDALRAFDGWASALIDAGDLEGAAGVLETCRQALDERLLEETRFGQRLRSAFEAMSAREKLVRAVAERRARAPVRLTPARRAEPPFDRRAPPDARTFGPLDPAPALRRMGSSVPPPFPPTGF